MNTGAQLLWRWSRRVRRNGHGRGSEGAPEGREGRLPGDGRPVVAVVRSGLPSSPHTPATALSAHAPTTALGGGPGMRDLTPLPVLDEDQLAQLHYAFQPIVAVQSGACFGFEALLRGVDRLGFASIADFFDAAAAQGGLEALENKLHAKAITAFCALPGHAGRRLFLNRDARALRGLEHGPHHADTVPVVLEISEGHALYMGDSFPGVASRYRQRGHSIALDDFGVGFSSLKMLYEVQPDLIKIDRFFVAGIDRDSRKRSLVRHIIGCARSLGIALVAEGVETATEFYVCRDLGCDYVQGYLLERPRSDYETLPERIAVVERLNREDRRRPANGRGNGGGGSEGSSLADAMEPLPPLRVDAEKTLLLERFGDCDSLPVVPVVDVARHPLGLVRERDLKRVLYSRFGGELMRNKSYSDGLRRFVSPCPVCDVQAPLEQVIEAFSGENGADGVILTQDGGYAGFLSGHALIRLVHERNLAVATDQNPLTRLPGNTSILRHIENVLADRGQPQTLVYFDFDYFKPFNDTFGFRQGDRAILMFADMMKAWGGSVGGMDVFCGHIGGDDFFLAISGASLETLLPRLTALAAKFRTDAASLYDAAARAAGGIHAKDRDGHTRFFPMLAVSGVVVFLPSHRQPVSVEAVNDLIAAHKCQAKAAPDKLCVVIGTPCESVTGAGSIC